MARPCRAQVPLPSEDERQFHRPGQSFPMLRLRMNLYDFWRLTWVKRAHHSKDPLLADLGGKSVHRPGFSVLVWF